LLGFPLMGLHKYTHICIYTDTHIHQWLTTEA